MNKSNVLFLLLIMLFNSVFSQEEKVELKDYVTDQVGVFSEEEFNNINNKLKDFEAQTTNQFVVFIVKDLGVISIEELTGKIFNDNKLGQAKKDNGVLLLISKNDRKLRIEVGLGLEDKLTDAISSRIIREVIVPHFKSQNYYQGVNLGVNKIIATIDNSFKIIDKQKNEYSSTSGLKKDEQSSGEESSIFGFLFFFLFIIGLIVFVIITMINGVRNAAKSYSSSGASSYRSSSSYSSSSSSSGFSGGGGSSGGGGASGSW